MSEPRESSRFWADEPIREHPALIFLIDLISALAALAVVLPIHFALEALDAKPGGVSIWLLRASDVYLYSVWLAFLMMALLKFSVGRRTQNLKREIVHSFDEMMSQYVGELDLNMSKKEYGEYLAALGRIESKLVAGRGETSRHKTTRESRPVRIKLSSVVIGNIHTGDRLNAEKVALSKLAAELEVLRAEIRLKSADLKDHELAFVALADAERAAKQGNRNETLQYLRRAGQWALTIAQLVGVFSVVTAIQEALSLHDED